MFSEPATKNFMKIDLVTRENHLPDDSIDVGFGATKAFNKIKTLQAFDVCNFRK